MAADPELRRRCGAQSRKRGGTASGSAARSKGIEVSVPASCHRRPTGIADPSAHDAWMSWTTAASRVTSPVLTLDRPARHRPSRDELEAAINAADQLRSRRSRGAAVCARPVPGDEPGVARLRETLDRRTFTLTDSVLERHFLPIARRAGLSRPLTGQIVNGYKVDFYWPELGLVVETDGLRYHRTPAQQAKDAVRDQVHTAAGLTPLRFPRAQVVFEPSSVEETLIQGRAPALRKTVRVTDLHPHRRLPLRRRALRADRAPARAPATATAPAASGAPAAARPRRRASTGARSRLLQGEDLVKCWRHPDGGFEKCFCGECGAHLFSRNPDDPSADERAHGRVRQRPRRAARPGASSSRTRRRGSRSPTTGSSASPRARAPRLTACARRPALASTTP